MVLTTFEAACNKIIEISQEAARMLDAGATVAEVHRYQTARLAAEMMQFAEQVDDLKAARHQADGSADLFLGGEFDFALDEEEQSPAASSFNAVV